MDALRISGRHRGFLGVKNLRCMKTMQEMSKKNRRLIISVLKNMVLNITHTFFPNYSRKLLFDLVTDIGFTTEQLGVALKTLSDFKDRMNEKSILRCMKTGKFENGVAVRLITKDVVYACARRVETMPLGKLATCLVQEKKRRDAMVSEETWTNVEDNDDVVSDSESSSSQEGSYDEWSDGDYRRRKKSRSGVCVANRVQRAQLILSVEIQ